jgi:hypothetical protein
VARLLAIHAKSSRHEGVPMLEIRATDGSGNELEIDATALVKERIIVAD